MTPHTSPNAVQGLEECIRACRDCHAACLQTAMNHCLDTGGEHLAPPHFRLMIGCAQLCQTCADLMLMNMPSHHTVCAACAAICKACAQSCADLQDMEACVKACENCARSCEAMARTAHA